MTSKEKRRNTEKRKEKSRDAARCRRSKETEVYSDLSQNLPLPENVSSQLDKASIMRLSISYLNVCNILDLKQHNDDLETEQEQKMDALCSKALEGFLLILSKEGDIIYVSDTVSKYLGIQQIELTGQSIYEFAHPCDHDEIKDIMSVKPNNNQEQITDERIFFIRMKCTLTSKGRNVNLKSASYKVLKFTGRLVTKNSPRETMKINTSPVKVYPYLLAIGETIPHPVNIEVPLDSNTFLTKHDMDMHFTYCDDRVQELVGYNSEELIGKSLYNYHHAMDSHIIEKAFKDLFAKGQTMTGQYRLLSKKGGHVWVVTQGTIIYNTRTGKPQWVVCVHYVLSKIENKESILSEVQLPTAEDLLEPFRFELSTDKIFAPKTKADMEQKYFVPHDLKKTITLIDNEPDDLTHLAPMAGEGCIPLNFRTLGSQLFDESSTTDLSFSGGFKEEPDSIPLSMCRQKSSYITSNSVSPVSMSPRIGSPDDYTTMVSPQTVDIMDKFFSGMGANKSLNTDISKTPEVDNLFSMVTKQSVNTGASKTSEHEDMNQRAPFIPMIPHEDYGLIVSSASDLFKHNDDFNPGLFGTTESIFMPKEAIFEVPPQTSVRQNFRDLVGESTSAAKIEQAPSMLPIHLKRPRDMTSLEKGPPKTKKLRGDQIEASCSPDLGMSGNSRDSVLLNLLLTGEDRNHGYKVKSPFITCTGGSISSSSLSSLMPSLTQQDYEVNAPTQTSKLLHGADLLRALDVDVADYRSRPTCSSTN